MNPLPGQAPQFASLYFHDTEYATVTRKDGHLSLDEGLLRELAQMLEERNNLVKSFVTLRDLIASKRIPEELELVLHAHERVRPGHERKYNLPESSEVAALIVGKQHGPLDIVLRRKAQLTSNGEEKLDMISVGNRLRDPLCYPLIFFDGSGGWHSKLFYKVANSDKMEKISPMLFYSKLFFERKGEFNLILRSGRLFQQFLCEAAYTMEAERLSFLRYNQSKLRATNHTRLLELLGDAAMARNEVSAWTEGIPSSGTGQIGRLVVLPATYIGSDRYMRMKMHDIISISNSLGHPDVFLTMTCNPYWPEITDAIFEGQKPQDRPDICNRVFKMKQKMLLQYLKSENPFGRMIAHVSVIEFQKRGLPHAHIILFLDQKAKHDLQSSECVDKLISAEIPPNSDFFSSKLSSQAYDPQACTQLASAPCLRDGKCCRGFPKHFRDETGISEGANYISYRRRSLRDGGEVVRQPYLVHGSRYQDCTVDNSWVVPYSPQLLSMFQCHFNAELCISKVGSIKYLFKYVCKGLDRVTVEVRKPRNNQSAEIPRKDVTEEVVIDEIKDYQDARYLSATEADWRLRGYSIVEHNPNIVRLEVHLEGQHVVYFNEGEEQAALVQSKNKRTKLMAWFAANSRYKNASSIRYVDFPKFFTWNPKHRSWKPRVQYKILGSSPVSYDFSGSPQNVIGRMYTVSPREGEKYYLRTLLLHVPGATSFQNLLNVNGIIHTSFRDACCALGLLADDAEWQRCLDDAFATSFEPLTAVFSTILAFCEPSNPLRLWNDNVQKFLFDIRKRYAGISEAYTILSDDHRAVEYAMREVHAFLLEVNPRFSVSDFGLPEPQSELPDLPELDTCQKKTEEDLRKVVESSVACFNDEQSKDFNIIVNEILPGVTDKDHSRPFNL